MPDFDERGLLGLAFHPDYKNNGRFFVAYSGYLPGDSTLDKVVWWSHTNYVAEYRVSKTNPNKADPLSERIVTKIDWPQFNHNGHWIGFGPDGFLYISTGDGGYANDWGIGHNVTKGNGQDLDSLHGQDPPHRRGQDGREQGRVLRHPGRQPVRRPPGRQARDLGVRLPEPVAVRLRHGRQQAALLRRRPAEQLRGSRHRHEGRELRLAREGSQQVLRLREPEHASGELRVGRDDRSDHRVPELQRHPELQGARPSPAGSSTAGATGPGRASTSSGTGARSSPSGTAASTSRPSPAASGPWRT